MSRLTDVLTEIDTAKAEKPPRTAKTPKAVAATTDTPTTEKAPRKPKKSDAVPQPTAVEITEPQARPYRKLTINIDLEVLDALKDEKRRREKAGEPEATIGHIIEDAIRKLYQ